jgi:hypothetical protein
MNTPLDEVLASQEANYLLPFLWQRGEDEATIRAGEAQLLKLARACASQCPAAFKEYAG